MRDLKFPIQGADIPPMLGRAQIMQRLWRDLTKKTPSHLSLVGPRYAGKTVLFNALAERMRGEGSPYSMVTYWDLRHHTPQSDEEFRDALRDKLCDGIRTINIDYAEYLLADSCGYADISEVIDLLHKDGHSILMLWDSFDSPLRGGTLTRNLWDNLLDLCRKPNFRIVTSTRKELHELLRDEKSMASDFWGVFEGIVRVTVFDEGDVQVVLGLLSGLEFEAGAKTELINWSGGFPPLLLGLLNHITETRPGGTISSEEVNSVAPKAMDDPVLSGLISKLWEDCSIGARDLYLDLARHRNLEFAKTVKTDRACLMEKGFARHLGSRLTNSCRMLSHYVTDASLNMGSVARFFTTWDSYERNVRDVLELRLAQIPRFDDSLHRHLSQTILNVPEYPDHCLSTVTQFENRALDLIWQHEFGKEKNVPKELVDYWTTVSPNDKTIQSLQPAKPVPSDLGTQCAILQILTGSRQDFDCRAKCISKDTYVLINAIHGFRNRTQHPGGKSMHIAVAVVGILSCLELFACLERELGHCASLGS